MSGERGARALHGEHVSWIGHVREYLGALTPSDVTLYDPPIRMLTVAGTGNVVVVLDADDETVSANYVTIAVEATEILTEFAIRQVRSTSTTATGLKGFR